jgi:hypothetical protein
MVRREVPPLRELPHELLERRFHVSGREVLVWLGTDLIYGGVDILNADGTIRESWEDEVKADADLIAMMSGAGIPEQHAKEIASALMEERDRWTKSQAGKRWWRWGKDH